MPQTATQPTKDIQQFIKNESEFLKNNALSADNITGSLRSRLPSQGYAYFSKLSQNSYGIVYSPTSGENTIPAYFLGYNGADQRNVVPAYVDIPKNALPGSHLFTGQLSGCSVIVTDLDVNTYRVYHDGRVNSSVLYDNVVMAVDFKDYQNLTGNTETGLATVSMRYADGAWKLVLQKQDYKATPGGAPIPVLRESEEQKLVVRDPKLPNNYERVNQWATERSSLQQQLSEIARSYKIPTEGVGDGAYIGGLENTIYDEPAIASWKKLRDAVTLAIKADIKTQEAYRKNIMENRGKLSQWQYDAIIQSTQENISVGNRRLAIIQDLSSADFNWVNLQKKNKEGVGSVIQIDGNYDRQIVVEIGDGSPNGAPRLAAEFLYKKNSAISLWVRWDGKNFVTVQGDLVPLTKMSRIVVVAHGKTSTGKLGGLSANELASKLANLEISSRKLVPTGVARISLTACLGGDEYAVPGVGVKYATDLLKQMNSLNKPVTSVTVRESLVQVDQNGRKWTKSLASNDEPWLHNGGRAKYTVYFDKNGEARTRNDISDFDEQIPGVLPDVVSGPLGAVDERALLNQLTDQLSLSSPDAAVDGNLKRYAEQLAGVSADDLKKLRVQFPELSDAQLIEKAAVDATLRSLKGNTQAEEAFKVGTWTSSNAERFLAANNILAVSVDRLIVNPDALRKLIGSGSALDHIRLVAAVRQLEPALAAAIVKSLNESMDLSSRNLGKALSSGELNYSTTQRRGEAVSAVGGDALAVFTTLTSVQQIITNWSQLSSA
ncbi:C80 family cysteine peptidase, partial [Burkholderia ubonensis]